MFVGFDIGFKPLSLYHALSNLLPLQVPASLYTLCIPPPTHTQINFNIIILLLYNIIIILRRREPLRDPQIATEENVPCRVHVEGSVKLHAERLGTRPCVTGQGRSMTKLT